MAAEIVLKLLIVASLFMACCDAETFLTKMDEPTKQLIERARPSKHPRCFTQNQLDCKTTKYPDYDFDMLRWYYNATLRVCFPIFLVSGQNKACPGIIDWVVDLPYTKKECEDLCGEPCDIVHPNHFSEPGICMMDCAIPIPKDYMFPCQPSNFGCCPRNYEPPVVQSEKPMYIYEAALLNMSETITDNFTDFMVPNLNVVKVIMGPGI